MDKFQAMIDDKWSAVDSADGAERWLRQSEAAKTIPEARTGRETANAPITLPARLKQAVLTLLCVLGVFLTAAVGLLFVFWEYLG